MILTSSQICNMLFTEFGDDFYKYKCTSCEKQYKKGNGYTNLLNHLKRNHDNYEHEAQKAARRQNLLHLHLVSTRTRDLYRWIEWAVSDRLPLVFVERRLTRQNAALSMRYITLLSELHEVRVASELPDSFGLVLDGWTSSSLDYLAIFAMSDGSIDGVVTNSRGSDSDYYYYDLDCSSWRFLLLAFSPVEEEEDLSAQSHFDQIADNLSRYDKPWSTVKFMVGDNCSVNQYISRKEGAIPLIRCASHRFNLAVKDFLYTEEALIAKVQTLMTKLRTAILRRVSWLTPLLRNDTRWSSMYEMLELELLVEHEIHPLLLSRAEHEHIKELMKHLEKFEGVTKELQRTSLTLPAVRCLFDQVVKEYPTLKARLVPTAPIVINPHLERGLRGEALLAAEKSACAEFRAPAREATSNATVKAALKKRRVSKCSNYVDVSYVPPTSNECERFFSATKLVLSDLRKSLSPNKLEMLLLLQYNHKMGDVHMVEKLRAKIGRNNAE
ncbi:hypothetical protein PHMEG_00033383 [Phytophthora megakarya]|uniref:BED-type domain-containing protein n=1 Tax=Phytophthora megakarya TaxID=4795 RepID=A0A225UTP9_9STRA|nr:hypothetical protein PHMEG_00033383 [Phytophthora megakarya]